MSFLISTLLSTGLLFIGMLIFQEIGRRFGQRRLRQDPDKALTGVSTIEGSIFGLLGLLVAFTFSGAASRFDARRQRIIAEANNIGTAYLRLDLLAAEARTELQGLFRQYTDSRIETYRKVPDMAAVKGEIAKSQELQNAMWNRSVAAM